MRDYQHVFAELTGSLVGQRIAFTRIAGDSLLLYVGYEPGGPEAVGFVLWFNPPWHVSTPEGVTAGSFPVSEASRDGQDELDAAAAPLRQLCGQRITQLLLDVRSNELTLSVGDDCLLVRTFLDDPEQDDAWHIHDRAGGRKLYGTAQGLVLD